MADYIISAVRDLKNQLSYSPPKIKSEQLDRMEKLFFSLQPGKSYPFGYIFYSITEHECTSRDAEKFFEAGVLRPDLRLLYSNISSGFVSAVPPDGGRLVPLADVEKRFSVSARTLYRWRRRGLLVRRYRQKCGAVRFLVRESTLESFVRENEDLISGAESRGKTADVPQDRIVARSRELARGREWGISRVVDELSREFSRSRETIRLAIRTWEDEHPADKIFTDSPRALSEDERGRIVEKYLSDRSIDELVRNFDCSRSTIYRVIRDVRTDEITNDVPEYVYNPEFDSPAAEAMILGPVKAPDHPEKKIYEGDWRFKNATGYFRDLYDLPILEREEEVDLFRRYNFAKYMTAKLKREQADGALSRRVFERMSRYEDVALGTRNRIIEANLRLVISIARHHARPSVPLDCLISEGNMSLLRAVEKFDYSFGFRFNTYLSWALMKDFSKHLAREYRRTVKFRPVEPENFTFLAVQSTEGAPDETMSAAELNALLKNAVDSLPERENVVLRARYGLDGRKLSLREIGGAIGVTKERVRQIEEMALLRIRAALTHESSSRRSLKPGE
jgi:RNA polymerase sigma factor (sigma-70 family)